MLSSKVAVGFLGAVLVSLTSCGSGDDGAATNVATQATSPAPEKAVTIAAPAPPAHGFSRVEHASLLDDGYSAPELSVDDLRIRLQDGKWSWFTPSDDRQLASLSESTRDDLAGEWFAPPAYATLPDGELIVFTWQKSKLGALTWSERAGEVFTEIPGAAGYAVFPQRVLALAPDDVWFAASATTDHFGPEFPGCPSIIRAGQDSGVIAHFDGRRWKVLPYRASGALTDIHLREPGTVEVTATGGSYLLSLNGTWTDVPGRLADSARAAGFTFEGGRVIRTRGAQREIVFEPQPEETDVNGHPVARAVHALPNGEVWLEVDILTGSEPEIAPEKEWWAWTE